MIRNKVLVDNQVFELDSLEKRVIDVKVPSAQGSAYRTLSEAYQNSGKPYYYKAEDWILKAIQADRTNDMQFNLGKDYMVYAKQLLAKDMSRQAKKNFGYAIKIFQTCGADGWVEKAEKDLALVK